MATLTLGNSGAIVLVENFAVDKSKNVSSLVAINARRNSGTKVLVKNFSVVKSQTVSSHITTRAPGNSRASVSVVTFAVVTAVAFCCTFVRFSGFHVS